MWSQEPDLVERHVRRVHLARPATQRATLTVHSLECSSNHRNYGVHVSFVRSTNLDIWSWAQLRTMKVGGNAAFAAFVKPGSSGNVKDRYTCAAAVKYRDELAKRSAVDLAQFGPGRIVTSDVAGAAGGAASAANGSAGADGGDADADFFDSWNKPATAPKPRSTGAASPLIALSPNGSRAGSRAGSPAPSPATAAPPVAPAAPAQPRTTTSASLRATTGTKAAGPSLGTSATRPMKLGASRIGSGAGASGLGARSKLGAAKASAPIDFDAAERKAREEEERIKQLGYDSRREAEEAAAKAQSNAANSAANAAAAAERRKAANAEVERAAASVQRLGFGQVTGMSGAESAAKVEAARKAAARAAAGYDNTGPSQRRSRSS